MKILRHSNQLSPEDYSEAISKSTEREIGTVTNKE